MTYNPHILLGRLTKLHGFEGAVTIKIEKTFIENLPEMKSVFLEIDGKQVPFFISESDYQGADILRLKFNEYNTSGKISEFIGSRVFLTAGRNTDTSAENFHDLTGYKILLPDNKILGAVIGIIKNPGQWLLNVETKKKREMLIPMHEDFIISVDNKKKVIKMDLPDGLTEIN